MHGDIDFDLFQSNLKPKNKKKLNTLFERHSRVEKEKINQNIEDDIKHLKIVNFCINAFQYGGSLQSATGYFFVRVEPLCMLGIKNFDIMFYNKDSKSALLVECKSSIWNPSKTLSEINEKIKATEQNRNMLENIVGDEIRSHEYVLCTLASESSKIKPKIIEEDLGICLWSADIFSDTLFLEKLKENIKGEINAGSLHSHGKLRNLLLKGVNSRMGSAPVVSFLPSSHPCIKLQEIGAMLNLKMEESRKEFFYFSDIQNIVEKETATLQFGTDEKKGITEDMLKLGLEIGIFEDKSPTKNKFLEKEFEFIARYPSVRGVTMGIKKHYVDFYSSEKAKTKALEDFKKTTRTLEEF